MGDLTEEKDRHPAVLVNKVVDHVYKLAQIAPVVCLSGNHDYAEEGHAFFEFLQRIPNTTWVREPVHLGDGLFLPHTPDYRRDWDGVDFSSSPYLYFHATFAGADLGNGIQADHGVPRKLIPRSAVAFCGDVHVPQETRPIIYVGAPYTVDFGDDYAASVIYRDGDRWDRIDTSHLGQKRSFHLISADPTIKRQHFNKGDIVQITVAVEDMASFAKVRDKIHREAESRELVVWAIKPKLVARAAKRQHKVVDLGSDEDLLDKFSKRHGLDERTQKAGRRLL
jgi:hypothetical protein